MSVTITTIPVPSATSTVSTPVYNTFIITVSGGKVYVGSPLITPQLASGQTVAPLVATVPVAAARVFNNIFFVDGTYLAELSLVTLAMVPYYDTAGIHPGPGTVATTITAVNNSPTSGFTTATATVASTAGYYVGMGVTISGASPAGYNGNFTVASVPSATTFTYVITGTPSTTVTGTILTNAALTTCCLTCDWRGRLVLAGDSVNPQNLYMSRSGVPTDWDYSQTDPAAAFALNLSTSGLIGEPITALIPFTDDIMLVGCTHSLWMLQGDPADGGTIIPVSQNIGVLGPNAWCKDSFDVLYFLGQGGLYKGRPLWEQWQPPELLTGENYTQYFQALIGSNIFPTLVWDEDAHYMHLFATPSDDATLGTHLIYDARNAGLWPIQFPLAQGPTAAISWYADATPSARTILLGGWDGKIRKLDNSALDDDGTAITANLTFGPFKPFPEAGTLSGTTIDFGEVLTSQAGNTPNQVLQETPSGTVNGVNKTFTLAHAHVLTNSVQLYDVFGTLLSQGSGAGRYVVTSTGTITMGTAPSFAVKVNYGYQGSPANPWDVSVTLASGPDAFEVTEGTPHSQIVVACTLERRQKTFRQRLRGGWFSLTISNNQLDTYFSFESALLEFHDAGRNRERR